jgi:hypothetical protein
VIVLMAFWKAVTNNFLEIQISKMKAGKD